MAKRIIIIAAAFAFTLPLQAAEAQTVSSVSEVRNEIKEVEAQYSELNERLESARERERNLRSQLNSLREQSSAKEAEQRRALERLNQKYRELIDNPEVDMSAAQKEYADAVRAQRDHQKEIASVSSSLSEQRETTEELEQRQHNLVNQTELLKEELQFARVDRLRKEFTLEAEVGTSQSLTCERTETLMQCENRAEQLAKQKVTQSYLDDLFNGLSESSLAKSNQGDGGASVLVLGASVANSAYSGQRNYKVELQVKVRGQLPENGPCQLLDLESRYCETTLSAQRSLEGPESSKKSSAEPVSYRLLIRSNVFDDRVYVNGERYGSTPVRLTLEEGEHRIEIARQGYDSYTKTIDLNDDQSLFGELSPSNELFTAGEFVRDVTRGGLEGPRLVVVPSGNQRVGDLTGNGRSNERPVRNFELSAPRAIGITPVTVGDFRRFIEAANYVSTADKGKGCAELKDGEIVFSTSRSWDKPGYPLAEDLPVTCVSYQDATAYVEWLSATTGAKYSLPTEEFWEYSSRANQSTDFWWGNKVGVNQINCRGCGQKWAAKPAPVGSFESNAWGLHDVAGNVWELTYSEEDPQSIVIRGGAFNFAPSLARLSARVKVSSNFNSNYIGFRVSRTE
ncbi:SUMF1/EgtB/PvdO family nonheme iron enzyme [Aliidiomarina sp. Khilg15.8]